MSDFILYFWEHDDKLMIIRLVFSSIPLFLYSRHMDRCRCQTVGERRRAGRLQGQLAVGGVGCYRGAGRGLPCGLPCASAPQARQGQRPAPAPRPQHAATAAAR